MSTLDEVSRSVGVYRQRVRRTSPEGETAWRTGGPKGPRNCTSAEGAAAAGGEPAGGDRDGEGRALGDEEAGRGGSKEEVRWVFLG